MARVELPREIAAIRGRVGNLVFRSRKQPDGTYKVFVHEYKGEGRKVKGESTLSPVVGPRMDRKRTEGGSKKRGMASRIKEEEK